MPQINDIRELAQQNARYVSNSPQDWMSYLDVAARLYRYSFTDTLLIHAQRPDATACAELELWNQKMSRWVNRGAKGIALLDDTGPRTKLRYVFDIADTHLVRGGRTPLLWNLDSHEHEQIILDHLADTYGLSQTDSMNTALLELAQQLTADNLDEAMDGLAYEVAGTFLEELDEDNIRVRFRELMTNSIFYTLSRRCGQEPMDVLDDDDFIRIVDFNKLPVLSFLGNAVSEQCEAVLFDIGREMRKIYKKEITHQLEKSVDSLYNTNTDFSTLKREIKENTTKGGQENGVDVLPQGRLYVPESGREGRAADYREVRDAAQDVPEREPQELVSEYADERQTEPASGADRGSSGEPDGNPAGQPEREVSGTEQGEGPAGMGGTPEQPDGDGRRDRFEGIGVQLTEPTTEQDLSEAEEEIASAFSFPDLPTVEQQIRAIEAPIQARYADEIALDSEVVDEILRTGSNRSKGQLRLIYNFMVEKTPEEYTEFVKNEYGTGGKGFEIGGAKYAVWFDDLGLRIAAGDTAKGGTIVNAFLSWEDVSNRIHELLRQGEYAPQAVLDAARQNALQEHAQTLAYMERDLADGVAEAVFQDTEIFRGGFPELTDRLAGLLDDADFLTDLNDRLSALGEAYAEDKDLMRMHFYKPDKVAALFQQFAKPYQNYSARDGFHWNEYKKFITEDEINGYFTRESNYSDSRLAIYSLFLNHEDKKERADFLKKHYGIGGSSHALCGADDSHEDHDGRGIALERGSYGNPYASVHLNWNQAAGRIDQLIRDSEYLKPADYSRMRAYERERMAMRVMGFYHHLPNEVERPYPQDLYHEEGRKALVEKLADPEQATELLEQMDTALLSVPMDSEEYERKAESLSILHQYVEGTYTIFPEKKRAVEIVGPEQGQMSMFDFMEQEPQSKEQSTVAAVEEPQKDAPLADEKPSEQMLQPMPLDEANEYNALKERYPDALVGYEQYGNFEFYGEDARRVSALLGTKILEKETALGKVDVSGFPREQWVWQAMKLWKQGENVYLSGQQEDGSHTQTKYFRKEEYLPVNTLIELDSREFRVDSVNFKQGTVSLQDMTLAKEARYPIFRTEPLEYIRHLYEQADVPMEEAVEITVFTALHNAGVAYEDFSPEQMDVIYSVAESGGELEDLLNPEFPPEQMQLIADVQNRTDAISRAAAEEAMEPLIKQPMTPAEVNHARRQHNLPLDSGAETELPAQPKKEPMNFRITDDDLGAGGPKTKYKANVEAIRVLQTLDAEQRQATAEEQEILSRYVGWGGIPQAFDLGETSEGYSINQYFAQHPEMVLGEITTESTQYGKQETTVKPIEGADLAQQLKEAVSSIHATITEPEISDDELDGQEEPIPADPSVKNFSFTNVDGQIYYRENSFMNKVELPAVTAERVLGMIAQRETTRKLLDCQLHDGSDAEVQLLQNELKQQYTAFKAQYGLINSTANKRAFRQDSSYCLLASLEILDEEKNLKRLADIFTKRTIRKPEPVTSVDTPSEALALSIGEKAKVDIPFMVQLCGKPKQEITDELAGAIFRNPVTQQWETSDEYLSGNVREKLATAETFAANHAEYQINVDYLKRVQPKDLDASEIEVRLGANWVKPEYITQFMKEVFKTPNYYAGIDIKATYSEISGAWNISGKSLDRGNPLVTNTFGTMRVNGYKLLEDALNLRDTKIYDTIHDADGDHRVLNKQETMLAQQAQESMMMCGKSWWREVFPARKWRSFTSTTQKPKRQSFLQRCAPDRCVF